MVKFLSDLKAGLLGVVVLVDTRKESLLLIVPQWLMTYMCVPCQLMTYTRVP